MLPEALKKLPITSITPFTFQDYPEHTACILWFSGCNMRCGYCHNPELACGTLKKLPPLQVHSFLESRHGLLEGVVLSGGECTLSPVLPEFASYLKSLGYKIKIDTNGSNPDMLQTLLHHNLVDYIALDFKAPEAKYKAVTDTNGYELLKRTLAIVCDCKARVEIRTTVHTGLLQEDDINNILAVLEEYYFAEHFAGHYTLQNYRHCSTLGNMPAQPYRLEISKLDHPKFPMEHKNFY